MSELPKGWKLRCATPDEYERLQKIMLGAKTMESAKKSVEKILEIAKKHGYDCVVAFKKGDDAYAGVHGDTYSSDVGYTFCKAFIDAFKICKGNDKQDGK